MRFFENLAVLSSLVIRNGALALHLRFSKKQRIALRELAEFLETEDEAETIGVLLSATHEEMVRRREAAARKAEKNGETPEQEVKAETPEPAREVVHDI